MAVDGELSRTSLPEQIKDRILAQILAGEYRPGDRLVELRIAEEMQTSQAPVREALRELEALGVVECQRNKGPRVRTVSGAELREMYDVRAQIEGYATELAVRAGAPSKSMLNALLRNMRAAARANDAAGFAECNSAFHRAIVEAAGNGVLRDVWETLNIKARTMVNVSRRTRGLVELADSHRVIIDAIATGQPTTARRVAIEHVLANKPADTED